MFQKKVVGTRRLKYGVSRGFAARDGSAVKSHSTILQRLRRQISLDYYTIPPAKQARVSGHTYNTPEVGEGVITAQKGEK